MAAFVKRILFVLLTVIVSCCGCISAKLLNKADLDRKPDIIKHINNAYVDDEHNVVINFDARMSKGPTKQYHIRANMDTVLSNYRDSKSNLEGGKTLYIEYDRAIVDCGYLPGNLVYSIKVDKYSGKTKYRFDSTFIEKDKSGNSRKEFLNARHLVFIFVADSSLKLSPMLEGKKIILSIAPSPEHNKARYYLLFITIPLDIITAVVQVVGFFGKLFK